MEETSEVRINVDLEGTEKVVLSFRRLGDEAGGLSKKITESSKKMKEDTEKSTEDISKSYIRLGSQAAQLGMNVFQLTDIVERFSKGQIDAAKFTVLFAGNVMQAITNVSNMAKAVSELGLATKILTIIEWAHNLSLAVKIGLLTLGIGLVAAAAATWWYMSQMQSMSVPTPGLPGRQHGGAVLETGPYLLHAGEYVLPKETVREISSFSSHLSITNNVTIENPVFRSRSDMDYLVDRLKRMGMA